MQLTTKRAGSSLVARLTKTQIFIVFLKEHSSTQKYFYMKISHFYYVLYYTTISVKVLGRDIVV